MVTDQVPPPERGIGQSAYEVTSRLSWLEKQVSELKGAHPHMATKTDVANAKLWMIAGIVGGIVSVLSVIVNLMRPFFQSPQ